TRERQLTAAKAFRARLTLEHQLLLRLHTAVTTDQLSVQVPSHPAHRLPPSLMGKGGRPRQGQTGEGSRQGASLWPYAKRSQTSCRPKSSWRSWRACAAPT